MSSFHCQHKEMFWWFSTITLKTAQPRTMAWDCHTVNKKKSLPFVNTQIIQIVIWPCRHPVYLAIPWGTLRVKVLHSWHPVSQFCYWLDKPSHNNIQICNIENQFELLSEERIHSDTFVINTNNAWRAAFVNIYLYAWNKINNANSVVH